jgi:hypothetical protein
MTPTNPHAQCEHLKYFISDKRIAHCQVCGECGVLSEVTGVLWGREYLPPEERERAKVLAQARHWTERLRADADAIDGKVARRMYAPDTLRGIADTLDALLAMNPVKPPAPSTPAPAQSELHPTPAGTPRAPEACRSAPSSPA